MPRTLPLPKGNEKTWLHLLPPEHLRQHGRMVYMFRNSQTNQVVYTHHPRIEQRTLRQLPFIGKHSVPPRIRPDVWKAHCRIGPFPTGQQGRDALKKLRELRKLHEYSWKETDPSLGKEGKKRLIRALMNQRANASADLAKVLSIQAEMGKEAEQKRERMKVERTNFFKKKWAQIKAFAESNPESEVQKLMESVQNLEKEREQKLNDNEEARRLKNIIREVRGKIRKITWSHNMVKEGERKAFQALVPKQLAQLPQPYSVNGIECRWADLVDSEFAAAWPEGVVHATFAKPKVLTEDEYQDILRRELYRVERRTQAIVEEWEFQMTNLRREREGLPPLEWKPKQVKAAEEEKPKKGIMKYMPDFIANLGPVKRMTA